MSYFTPYFDNFMKNLGVTYDNFLSQNLAKSKFTDSRCYLHDSQRSTGHNSVFFASQIFNEHLETWYILIIWWKIWFLSAIWYVQQNLGFLFISQYLSHFWIFGSQIFTKCLISCHILIIWWKIWVLLTIIFCLKFWLSPSSLTVDVTSMTAKDQLDITQSC